MKMKFSRSHFRLQALQKPGLRRPPARFVMRTKDNSVTFDIFERVDDDHTQLVCTTTSEAYAEFITAALTCAPTPPVSRQPSYKGVKAQALLQVCEKQNSRRLENWVETADGFCCRLI